MNHPERPSHPEADSTSVFDQLGQTARLSVYVHVPFCRSRCDYCDFFTRTGVSDGRISRLLDRTIDQLHVFLSRLSPLEVPSVYVGGGTPSSIGTDRLSSFLQRLRPNRLERPSQQPNRLEPARPQPDRLNAERTEPHPAKTQKANPARSEFTVEVNPEDLNEDLLTTLDNTGVNRLSVGIQRLKTEFLETIGRHVSLKDTIAGLETVAQYWPHNWSADLIVGVPGDSNSAALADVKELVSYGPPHISVYDLTVEPRTRLARGVERGLVQPVSEQVKSDVFEAVRSCLLTRGYRHYEIGNFAMPGYESVHNRRYWQMEPHIGVGPAAVGTLIDRTGTPIRISNTRRFVRFLNDPDFGLTIEQLSPKEFFFEYLMMGLRTDGGVSRKAMKEVFSADPVSLVPETLDRWAHVLHVSSSYVSLTWDGRRLLNRFLVEAYAELDRGGEIRFA